MANYIQGLLEGKIVNFQGQKVADDIVKYALIASTIFSFILGFALQSLRVTFGTLGFSTIVLCLVVLPPWSMYNQHPVKWLPVEETKKST
ncbi:hypothetical protein SERLA73DRAFT_184338 [Serpula lacrymans var. lacrymans S7.3]|uniref:Signal peptidase complex subunit 1 n=2 Tax=Serpula lacrymans var. lacrymans TaxID=341189 RepID=F8Q319_SERL3|nr:uncharacterized protein SERLADRAFT_471979 [Serpula lacrymans var. lacrymans S7.9]EGN97580.1 hypothetical protein SERLA73DRAFT_184338 [Serpula lacrymans var. lacrymans S7.3]EGO23176.1 hypothetical protein SERLADRAFT_471979 [Serpula lacrymans var. lacrymans S7.9]